MNPRKPSKAKCDHISLHGLMWIDLNGKKNNKLSTPLHCVTCKKTAKEMDAETKKSKPKRKIKNA